ncbi:MAG: HAD family hydrolase [Lentisphaeria bacterium]|nr:HAD-IA family hydrolase [Lentisphaeria bacterium]NQZ68949.1 HAD family hydrolase [Lentisphaeria bacterium]
MTPIKAVLFDFDDTLTNPGAIDFPALRHDLGISEGDNILAYVDSLPEAEQIEKNAILNDYEMRASASASAAEGAEDLILFLMEKSIPLGIITRNRLKPIMRSLENFPQINADHFKVIVSRDDPFPAKPAADGVIHAAKIMQVDCQNVLVVGDYIYDIEAGQNAGAQTAWINHKENLEFQNKADFEITKLADLYVILKL